MTREELLAQFRREVEDQAEPYLWSDDEVLLYLVDAQDMFARLTGGIADETVPAASDPNDLRLHDLALTSGEAYSALSQYILRTRYGRLQTAARDVMLGNLADLKQSGRMDYGSWIADTLDDTEGQVNTGLLDIRDGYVRWVYIPDANDTCRLVVLRLPYPRMTADNDVELEVAGIHHLHLVKWMKHLAYSKEDAETYDKALADRSKVRFEEYCAQAKAELERQRFRPRVVQYGGI